jgi:hypothetical protein
MTAATLFWKTMHRLLFALVLCALPHAAQSWETVRALGAGTRVKVRETNGPEHKGTVAAVTPEAISVSTGRANVSVARARVSRVQVHKTNRRLRNIAIGAGIGLAVGITVDQTVGAYLRNETGDSARALTYIAPIGLFTALGASLSPYQTVYRLN